jgi:hypothetical protein
MTLEKDSARAITAQAEPQSDPAIPRSNDGSSESGATEELAKAAQNPISNLISLPFQNNTILGVGPQGERTQNVVNIQPVIPVPLSKNLLLVTRTIVPFIYQPTAPSGNEGEFGLGDINPQFYFRPRTKSTSPWASVPLSFYRPRPSPSLARGNGVRGQPLWWCSPPNTWCLAPWATMSGLLPVRVIAKRSISS